MPTPLTHVVGRAHQLLAEVLAEGELAIDLTAGNGYDTLFLAQQVGESGCVLAFDVQPQAISNSLKLLTDHGIRCCRCNNHRASFPGVNLVQENHAELKSWCQASPMAIIANLGFLPGGSRTLVTMVTSTLAALDSAVEILSLGGRLAVVVYPGHEGGAAEADAVKTFFYRLDAKGYGVLCLTPLNRCNSPYLLVAEKFKTR